MKLGKKIAVSLLGIICTASLAGGLSACKAKKSPVGMPEHLTTVRMALPNDGSLPTAHSGLENIGYMATVLDNQPYYHAYARNSAKIMGYEQITQTWKDYKGKELSGYDGGVMVCSDLSYSTFVKSGTQACFVNDKAYMRSSSKPGKSTTGTNANWNTGTPEYYDKDTYLTRYGEFSTEISVYVINEDTINSWSDVTTNEDGTYSQTYYLNDQAACYYQYKLKTNGNLKGYPDFEYINITFNFDKDWNVVSTYCEEKAKVAPKALGGAANKGTFKTTTSFYYGEGDFDNAHYAYFDDYFKNYVGKDIAVGGGDNQGEQKPELLDVLAGGFSKVIGEGQQFSAKLKIGDTDYDGKVYARLADMSDILNSLDVRLALEKAGSGKQDLYLEFKNGAVNVYYSDNFAMTANLDAVKTVVGQFTEWVKRFEKPAQAASTAYTVAEEEESGLDLAQLLASLKLTYTDNSATISLESDNLLGTGIGAKVSLDFNRTIEEDGSNSYSFKNASLGSITYGKDSVKLSLGLSPDGSAVISRNPVSTAANLADYAESVYGMLNSETVKVNIGIDGTKQGVISYLDGVKLSAEAYVALGSEIATKANIFAEYAGLSVKLSAYYDVNIHGGNYGKVYINLTEFNGTNLDAKVYSNLNDTVNSVKRLISAVNGATASPAALAAAQSEQNANKLAGIVNGVLSLNFGEVLGDLYASNSEIRVKADVDKIIGALGLNLNGVEFGTAALKLNLDNKKNSSLSLGLSGLGLDMKVEGSSQELTEPDKELYLDSTALVNLVTKATDEAKKIIAAQDIIFGIEATAVIDDVPLSVNGTGEVVWKNGKMRVALDVNLSVANGTSSAAKDTVALKLVYDESVTDNDKPFVKFSVGNLAMQICRDDLTEVKNDVNLIKKNIDLLINGEKTGNATPAQAVSYGVAAQSAAVTEDIKAVLANENVQTVLSAVLGFAGDLNVELSGKDLNTLVIKHLTNGSLTLGTNNDLSLVFNAENDNGTPIIDLSASVKVGGGAKLSAVSAAIDELDTFSTADAGEAFATVVYNYLFATFDSLSVKNVLGSDTFAVNVAIDGNKSAIPQLSGVTVNAGLYYTEALEGATVAENRLVEADIDLDIKGTTVKANARYSGQNLYISLDELNGTALTGVKFTASRHDIYTAADRLIKIISDENIVKSLSKLIHPAAQTSASEASSEAMPVALADEGERSAVTDVISKLLSFDFAKAFTFGKVNGANTATVEVDYILGAFGVSAPQIGTATVGVNPVSHKIDASLSLEDGAWATLTAEATKEHTYDANWKDGYTDIAFINTLLDDIVKTTVKNGEFQTLYTLKGNLNLNITVVGDVPIDNVTLTAGLDENGKFYFSFTGNLDSKSTLGFTVTKKMPISVTYSDGYITMGRTNNDGNPIYKVMTMQYLMTNLLDENDSPIRWLLGTSDWAWGKICGALNLNIDAGLTKPDTYYLYEQNEVVKPVEPTEPTEQKTFNLSDLLVGLTVKLAGENANTVYGDAGSAITKLELTDNYYALDANLKNLLGDTFSNVYLGILRGENGLTGLKAYTEIAGALKVTVNLDALTTDKAEAAPDYLPVVLKDYDIDFHKYDNAGMDAEHKKPTFGCYNTENDSYATLDELGSVKLTVVGGGIAESHDVTLKSTSTVYLRDAASPVWANDEHTRIVIYTDKDGNDLGTSIRITADTTIYAATTEAYEIIFDLGENGESYVMIMTPNDELAPATVESETRIFAGWYADGGFTIPATRAADLTAAGGVRTVYAKFIDKEYTAENGVKYSAYFDEQGNTRFAVSGFDPSAVTDGTDYTASVSTLIIADNVAGVTVDKINANAFDGKNLKNVIVPESITLVGTNAFSQNYGMESVIFFAGRVGFDGTYDGKTYPFYNCSVSSGSDKTILKIYYNDIYSTSGEGVNKENNPYWSHYYSVSNSKLRYVGGNDGGERISDGWSFVEYTQTGEDMKALNCLVSGIKRDEITVDKIEAAVVAELNARTAKDGYINAYTVTVSGGYELNGKLYNITVNVTEATAYYLLTVNCADACTAEYFVAEENQVTLDGKVYVKAGATVTVKAKADAEGIFTFAGWNGASFADATAMNTTFVMSANAAVVNAEWTANYAENTYVYSAIEYTYEGKSYQTGNQQITNALADHALKAPVPVDTSYTFIGWAKEDNGLNFVGNINVDKYAEVTYYAIWAVKHGGVEFPVNASGNQPAVNVTGDGEFYNWYAAADADFTGSTISAEISTDNTVFRARLQYNFAVTFTGNGDTTFNTTSNIVGVNSGSVNGRSYTMSFDVLEGASVNVEMVEVSGNYIMSTKYWNKVVISYGEQTIEMHAYKQNKNDNNNRRTFEINSIVQNGKTETVDLGTGSSRSFTKVINNVTMTGSF